MTDERRDALAAVDRVLDQLRELNDPGPTWLERNGGWTTASRAAWLERFGEIRDRLLAGDASFAYEGHHLVRFLDHDSIVGGPILQKASELQQRLFEISRRPS